MSGLEDGIEQPTGSLGASLARWREPVRDRGGKHSSLTPPCFAQGFGKVPERECRGHRQPWECQQGGLGQFRKYSNRNIKLTHFSSMTREGCRPRAKLLTGGTPGQSSIHAGQLPSLPCTTPLALGSGDQKSSASLPATHSLASSCLQTPQQLLRETLV